MNWLLLKNSLLVSSLTMMLAGSLGFFAAVWLMGLGARFRMYVLTIAILSLALPPFLVTNCWLDLLGQTGIWRRLLPLNIVSLGGTVWILSLLFWPITLFAVSSAWKRLQPSQLEGDPLLRGWRLVRCLLFPMARVSLAQAAALTFILSLNNFSVPAILQVKVFPADVWIRFNANLLPGPMLVRSWPLVVAPLILLLAISRADFSWPRLEGLVSPALFRRQLGRGLFYICGGATIGLCLLTLGLPLLELISLKRTWTELPGALAANQSAIWNSFWFAAAAALLTVALPLLRATRSEVGGRFFSRVAKSFSTAVPETLLWLPLLVPGVVLGLALIFLLNRPWLLFFYRSTGIIILAFVIRYFALGWQSVVQASRGVDQDLISDARLNGASRWQILRFVQWPQIAPQLIAAWYIIFLLCLWDVESIILIWPPGRETLALSVFNLLHYGHNAQVNALCLTLLGLAVAPLAIWKLLYAARRALLSTRGARMWNVLLIGCLAQLITACSPTESNEAPLSSEIFNRVQIIGHRGVGVGELNKPRSVAVDRQDNLYVVDMTGRVQKFSSNGVFLLSWQLPQTDLGKPKGMARDQDGNIIVLEPHYQRLNHFASNGVLVAQWGQKGTNAGQFMLPRAVAVNSRGEIYVSEYGAAERVQQFRIVKHMDSSGVNSSPLGAETQSTGQASVEFLYGFGVPGTGPGDFNRPEGLCIDTKDRLYVADSCNHRIQIFSSDGKFIRTYGKAGKQKGELSYPYDICVDSSGRQYVCEFGNSRIQVFDANDRAIEIIGGPGIEPGLFSNPWGVALDSVGNLYVADSQNHRVQKLIRNQKLTSKSIASAGSLEARRSIGQLGIRRP